MSISMNCCLASASLFCLRYTMPSLFLVTVSLGVMLITIEYSITATESGRSSPS